MKKYKIVAIAQIYNEIEKGNLERFFKYVEKCVDDVVIYDDCSTDGSFEYAQTRTKWVLRGSKNDFSEEVLHKQLLLESALTLKPDFILSIDADEVVAREGRVGLEQLCAMCEEQDLDGIEFQLVNLWRSGNWKRVDSLYNEGWFTKLWRVTPSIMFSEAKNGLHQRLFPDTIKKTARQDILKLIHYGFSDDINLAHKYLTYKSHGQRGYEMLDRLVSEDLLVLEEVSASLFPDGLYRKDARPVQRTFAEALDAVERLKNKVRRPKYTIACLIYKSTEWLDFVYQQILKHTDLSDVEFYFVANDAEKHVIDHLKSNHIPHYVHCNSTSQRDEWYINNVYRAYNKAVELAAGDFVVLINSDMCFSEGWLASLVAAYDGKSVIASRLVESGKLQTGEHGIEKNFGTDIGSYLEDAFLDFANSISRDEVAAGGLFMPILVRKEHFLKVGGYPEGNLRRNADIFSNEIASQGEPNISGDVVFVKKLQTLGISHKTAFNSVVYHFQCGEKDSQPFSSETTNRATIAICNDVCGGLMGEKVLWNHLLENIAGAYPLDTRLVGRASFEKHARSKIDREYPATKLVIQNASFIDRIHPDLYTVCFLQDDLRKMGKSSAQQELNLRYSNKLVTNSIQTAISYPEYEFEIIPVGVDSNLFTPTDKTTAKSKHGFTTDKVGIFVGSLNAVKGWEKVEACIRHYHDITWIVVSKHQESFSADNVKMYCQIDQRLLAELLNCADVFLIGSPVETQCLAAIEANLCDVPVAMPLVGIYKDFNEQERATVGVFDENLIDAVSSVLKGSFSPRATIISKKLTVSDSMENWENLIEKSLTEANQKQLRRMSHTEPPQGLKRFWIAFTYGIRNLLIDHVLGDRYWKLSSLFTKRGLKHAIRETLIAANLLNTAKQVRKQLFGG